MITFLTGGMWSALRCALTRRQDGVGGTVHGFRTPPPTTGTIVGLLALAAAVAVLAVVVVPWPVVQVVLGLLALWFLLFVVAAVVVGTTHPHLLGDDALVLRYLGREVARVPLGAVGTVSLEAARDAAAPALANGRLHLPGPSGATSVRLDLMRPVPARFSRRIGGEVGQVTLDVTTPKTLVGELAARLPG